MSIQKPNIAPEEVQLRELTKFGTDNLNNWLKGGINKQSIDFSEKFGFCLARYTVGYNRNNNKPIIKGLSTNQIRKVFGEIKRIEMKLSNKSEEWSNLQSDFLLIKPKMAYSAKRDKTFPAECLYEIVAKSIDIIDKTNEEKKIESFNNFSKLFEAIIAYHRAYEEKQ